MAEPVDPAVLAADCARCAALCCVVPAFAASADFAIDKPAMTPCPNLRTDHRCGIHTELRDRGFAGCTVYDCFGAGQRVVQVTFGGRDRRSDPAPAAEMYAVFPTVRLLHELLWYLAEAQRRPETGDLRAAVDELAAETEQHAAGAPADLLRLDVEAHRARVAGLLRAVGDRVRAVAPPRSGRSRYGPGAELVGADLAGHDLRGADLRGALLIGARLQRADLGHANLIGADLRGADLRGARLADAVFVTRLQVAAAIGDAATTLPAALPRPGHWATGGRPAPPSPDRAPADG